MGKESTQFSEVLGNVDYIHFGDTSLKKIWSLCLDETEEIRTLSFSNIFVENVHNEISNKY